MKKILSIFFLICFMTSSLVQARENQARQKLEEASTQPVKTQFDSKSGSPQFISGRFEYSAGLTKAAVANKFCETHRAFLQIPESHDLKVIRTFKDGDNTVVRMSQSVNGVPIFGSDVAFNIDADNAVRVVSGKFYNVNFKTTPGISKGAAISRVINDLVDAKLTEAAQAELNGFVENGVGRLTWHVVSKTVTEDRTPGEWHTFVDAETGRVIAKFNNVKTIRNRATYDARQSVILPGVLLIDETGTSTDAIAQTAHNHASTTYDYFFNTHGRDSFDGGGATITQSVHYLVNYVNAFWNGSQFVYGDGDGTNSGPLGDALDVVAHEFTHGVTQHTANLIYRNQSGALNESMSDVFAVLIDADDWLVGEDTWTPGTPGDALRYMDNPELGNQPAHMDNYLVTNADNGGVHTNSGIPNKAFFNIATAVGRPAAGQIYYRALTVYMTASTNFLGARLAILQAAEDIFGAASLQAAAVESAFDAVGVLTPTDFVGTFVSSLASTTHPYPNNANSAVATFTNPGASKMKVRFTAFNTEAGVDIVTIRDEAGNSLYNYSGNLGAFTSGPVDGSSITVELHSNAITNAYGFDIDGYFGLMDATPPVISGVTVTELGTPWAKIAWTTDEFSTSQVEYGTTTAYGRFNAEFVPNPFNKKNHVRSIGLLQPATTYNFRVKSADDKGNLAVSGNFTFTTPPANDNVVIRKSRWRNNVLEMEATSTDANATLGVYGWRRGTQEAIFVANMNGKGGKYKFKRGLFFPVPDDVVVLSSNGGMGIINLGNTAGLVATTTEVPEEYELQQNYPNPFNPTTEIRYTMKETGPVTLKVYNIRGQVVATLVNGIQQQGQRIVTFDGSRLSSGSYFYQLQTPEGVLTRKLLLMK